jgi:sugar phosphate isomerase/epimerase
MIDEIKPTNASLSTMWAIGNYPDLNEFFQVSRQIGFPSIELNHQVDGSMLSVVNFDHYQFSSIHEPCPAEISSREIVNQDWLISSNSEESRKRGVEFTKNSIRLASQLNAPVVVIHCGNVTADMGLEAKLRGLFKQYGTESSQYHQIKAESIRIRSEQAGPRLAAVKKSLNELIDFAAPLNIRLGLENRYHIMDIPDLDEMGELLSIAEPSVLGFIYDVGHAQALDRLGLFPHEEWLRRYAPRMIGCHLHDVRGLTDHLAPGLGEMDFNWIADFLPSTAFRTLELQPFNTIAQVKDGVDHLINTGCISYL